MMKKLLALTFMLALAILSHAQALTIFPTDRDKFVKAIDQMMTASKADNLVHADDEFNKNIKSGAISDAQLQQIIKTANIPVN